MVRCLSAGGRVVNRCPKMTQFVYSSKAVKNDSHGSDISVISKKKIVSFRQMNFILKELNADNAVFGHFLRMSHFSFSTTYILLTM